MGFKGVYIAQTCFPDVVLAGHHYENMPMKYIKLSKAVKFENFRQKIFDNVTFPIFAQNIDCAGVHVRFAAARRFKRVPTIYVLEQK